MGVTGAKPQEIKRNRNPETYEWLEVVNTPYTGDKPSLPDHATLMSRGGNTYDMPWLPEVERWWEVMCRMPHCIHWTESDWEFALATTPIAQQAWMGNTGASAELRIRESKMGTTMDSRRDLRIKYVDHLSGSNDAATESNGAVVKPFNIDRRARLASA